MEQGRRRSSELGLEPSGPPWRHGPFPCPQGPSWRWPSPCGLLGVEPGLVWVLSAWSEIHSLSHCPFLQRPWSPQHRLPLRSQRGALRPLDLVAPLRVASLGSGIPTVLAPPPPASSPLCLRPCTPETACSTGPSTPWARRAGGERPLADAPSHPSWPPDQPLPLAEWPWHTRAGQSQGGLCLPGGQRVSGWGAAPFRAAWRRGRYRSWRRGRRLRGSQGATAKEKQSTWA